HLQFSPAQILLVYIGDLILSSRRWLKILCYGNDFIIVKIKTGYRETRFRFGWLFLDRHGIHLIVELYHSITLRIRYMISKDITALDIIQLLQLAAQSRSIKNIVPQNERYLVFSNKGCADHKCLRQSIGFLLYGIVKMATDLATVAEQSSELGVVFRR